MSSSKPQAGRGAGPTSSGTDFYPNDLRPKGPELIGLLAAMMSLGAVGIDMMLPTLGLLRAEFGLPSDSTQVARLVTAYFLGMAVGPIPYGALSDRFGRRPVVWLGAAIYLIGALASVVAPTLELMLVTRFVWGAGAAGARVVVLAVMRDSFDSERMARVFSFVMAVFLLVPIFAPAVGAALGSAFGWQAVYLAGAGFGLLVLVWSTRLSETLPVEERRSHVLALVLPTTKRICRRIDVAGPVLAMTALQTVLTSWLASFEFIVGEVYGRGPQFPIIFGASSVLMGAASLLNGRLLAKRGIHGVVGPASKFYLVGVVVIAVLTVATGQQPDFWIFIPSLAVVIALTLMLIPNLNTLALAPMADVAGTASAVIATITMASGAILGAVVDAQFSDTVTPLAVAMVIGGTVQAGFVTITLRQHRKGELPLSEATSIE